MALPVAAVVGRLDALDDAARFVDGLSDGPSALLVEGEAGIGKTTVWRSTATMAAARHQAEVARAADVAGHQDEHALRARGAELVHPHPVVAGGPGPGGAAHGHVALGAGGRRQRQRSGEHEDGGEPAGHGERQT